VSAPRILLVSNGFGEMAILASIARAIAAREPAAQLAHLPLVGNPPADAWPPTVGPRAAMPSGGLVTYWNLRNVIRDVRAGLLGLSLAQFSFLRRQRSAFDAAIAVGDIYCLAVCLWFLRLPVLFVATAKSEHVATHGPFELAIARRACATFARDAATAQALVRAGVRARYAGNAMMDGVARPELDLPRDPNAIVVALLPGSRADAATNVRDAARRLVLVAQQTGRRVQAFLALAPTVAAGDLTAALAAEQFDVSKTQAAVGIVASARRKGAELLLVRGGLAAALCAADVVLGQSGTGNEQAAGLGKPVVAAAGPGESPNSVGWYRMRQQRLLGDALAIFPSDDAAYARELMALLSDPERMRRMADAGRERMGAPGASDAIAAAALELIRRRCA